MQEANDSSKDQSFSMDQSGYGPESDQQDHAEAIHSDHYQSNIVK